METQFCFFFRDEIRIHQVVVNKIEMNKMN